VALPLPDFVPINGEEENKGDVEKVPNALGEPKTSLPSDMDGALDRVDIKVNDVGGDLE